MTSAARLPSSPVRTLEEAWRLVRAIADPSPLEPTTRLAARSQLLLKREDLGPNGSFKWRGALCAITAYASEGAEAIVTASTGNHGAATAWAARRAGLSAHVVVPAGAAGLKCSLIERNGAQLHRVGPNLDAAAGHARSLAAELDSPYFEDGASDAQLLGAATVGCELADAEPGAVIAPLAVGALAGGIALGLRAKGCECAVYGVQAEGFDAVARRLQGREGPRATDRPTFADGLADNRIVDPAFAACRRHLTGVTVASERALRQAVVELHSAEGILAEGAGAAALAGLRAGELDEASDQPTVLVISGRNLDPAQAERLIAAEPSARGLRHA